MLSIDKATRRVDLESFFGIVVPVFIGVVFVSALVSILIYDTFDNASPELRWTTAPVVEKTAHSPYKSGEVYWDLCFEVSEGIGCTSVSHERWDKTSIGEKFNVEYYVGKLSQKVDITQLP